MAAKEVQMLLKDVIFESEKLVIVTQNYSNLPNYSQIFRIYCS